MRTWIAMLVLTAGQVVFAEGSGRAPSGRSGRIGSHHPAGFSLDYRRPATHFNWSLSFGSGSCFYGSSSGYYVGGWPGAYGYGGTYIYRGWAPYSPYLYRSVPGASWRGVGPFERTDAVVFGDAPPVQAFGHGPRVAEAAEAPPAAPPPDPASAAIVPLLDRGDKCFARGEFDVAVGLYRLAARKAPQDPLAALALGHGLFAMGAYADAAAELRRGVRLYPAILEVPMSRRDFYGDPEAFDAQLDRLERFVEANPKDAAARFLLAYHCYFGPQRAKAAPQFRALGPADPEAQLFLRELERDK